jgi:hypothetical protein
MICPKCDKEGLKYNQKATKDKKNPFKRSDFSVKCNKCNWVGTC